MNFSDFCDNNSANEFNNDFNQSTKNFSKSTQKNSKNAQNFQNFYTEDKKQDIQNKLSKYQNMSESDLMAELVKETNKQKQNGSLDSKKLDEIKNSISPMLNAEQASRLDSLIKMLK